MGHTPHDLNAEFPTKIPMIRDLKNSDGHFRRLADEYDKVNAAIHRAETNLEPTDQFAEEDLRKQRLHLKDQIARALA